jgi:hypothetical protein
MGGSDGTHPTPSNPTVQRNLQLHILVRGQFHVAFVMGGRHDDEVTCPSRAPRGGRVQIREEVGLVLDFLVQFRWGPFLLFVVHVVPGSFQQYDSQRTLFHPIDPRVVPFEQQQVPVEYPAPGGGTQNSLEEVARVLGFAVDAGGDELGGRQQVLPQIVPHPHVDVEVDATVLVQGRPATNVRLEHSDGFGPKIGNEGRIHPSEGLDAILIGPEQDPLQFRLMDVDRVTNVGRQYSFFIVHGARVLLEQILVVREDQNVRDRVPPLLMVGRSCVSVKVAHDDSLPTRTVRRRSVAAVVVAAAAAAAADAPTLIPWKWRHRRGSRPALSSHAWGRIR